MKIKRILSFILTAAMMLSIFVIPSTAVGAETNSVVVHYFNENNWANPYIYYYEGDNKPVEWPGTAMTSDGEGWYSYTISGMSQAKVIFSNNGASQYPAQNQPGLDFSGEKWYKQGKFYTYNPDTEKTVVHYYNTNGWSLPYIYYYDGDNKPVEWPGTAMTSNGEGWYSYTISGMSQAKVIFSDNGANQYPAKDEQGLDVSGEKWFANGSWHDSEPEGITVHFQNYDNWNKVNIYYYNGSREGTSWTGIPMSSDGDGWYTYKILGYDEARVLFNNGNGTQIPPAMEEGFLVSGDMWYRNGTWTTERPEEVTVYFYKPSDWSTPNIYYYKSDSDKGPAWPGSAMKHVQDSWYTYTITKYSEAKVMFNSGSKQIPAQNQPGLDAKGVMWYKDGVWCNTETDTDNDQLPDYMELVLGTDRTKSDTDGDGLPDGYEVFTLGTDPTKADSDDNGTNDGAEDADNDGLTNLKEYQLGTDPTKADSDNDGLKDGKEVNTYKTDPLKNDTDGDTLSDGDDVALGFSPLLKDTDGNGILDCDEKIQQSITSDNKILSDINTEDNKYTLSVESKTSGYLEGNLTAKVSDYKIENDAMIGKAVDLSCSNNNNIENIVLKYKIDDKYINNTLNKFSDAEEMRGIKRLNIFKYFDDINMLLPIATEYDTENNIISTDVDEFGTYCVMDLEVWLDGMGIQANKFSQSKAKNIVSDNVALNSKSIHSPNNSFDELMYNSYLSQDVVFVLQDLGPDPSLFYNYVDTILATSDLLFKYGLPIRIKVLVCGMEVKPIWLKSNDINGEWFYNTEDISNALSKITFKESYGIINMSTVCYELGGVELNKHNCNYVYTFFTTFLYKYSSHTPHNCIMHNSKSMMHYSEIHQEHDETSILEINGTHGQLFDFNSGTKYEIFNHFKSKVPEYIYDHFPQVKPDNPTPDPDPEPDPDPDESENNKEFVIPTTYKRITLDENLEKDGSTDTDGDTLTDWEEVDNSTGLVTFDEKGNVNLPTLFDCLELKNYNKYIKNFETSHPLALGLCAQIKVLPILSDPTMKDTDGDGLNDSLDSEPLNYSVNKFLIYETENNDIDLKSLSLEKRPNDYQYAEKSMSDLCKMFPITILDFMNCGDKSYIIDMAELMAICSNGDMRNVAIDMMNHFLDGSGNDYYNDILSREVENHDSTKEYVDSVSSIINEYIKSNNGNILPLKYIKGENRKKCYMPKIMTDKDIYQPSFEDYFGGLGICVHGLYGNKFEVTSYEFDGKNYKYTLHFTMYDIFGLDNHDITDFNKYNGYKPFGFIQGFRSWYILQHYDIYNGKYKPFISYMEFDKTFEGSIL